MSLAKEKMLIIIPVKTESRKLPFTCFQKSFNLKVTRNFNAVRLTDFRECISSSYIPVINAIVPPDTPGIISEAPIPIPLRVSRA